MSGERIYPEEIKTPEEYLIYLKEVFIYTWCKEKISQNDCCLDAGCGEGYGTKLLSSAVKKIVGIDIDKKIIGKASKKYAGNNRAYQLYDGKTIPFADNYFDMIVSFHAIEHIKNDIGFIDEMYRVLKDNGRLIITTPNKAIRLAGNMPSWNVFHIREYTPDELKRLLTKRFKEVAILGIDAVSEVKNSKRKESKKT
ncbi:MAG: class I SAM-dependent methyltransferase [Candidatus Omnitrophota bacterium]